MIGGEKKGNRGRKGKHVYVQVWECDWHKDGRKNEGSGVRLGVKLGRRSSGRFSDSLD